MENGQALRLILPVKFSVIEMGKNKERAKSNLGKKTYPKKAEVCALHRELKMYY